MDNRDDVMDSIEALYTMVAEAWGVPLGNEKCIVDRDKVLSLLDEIKQKLPSEMAEARRIVSNRNDYVGGARKEADAILLTAQERAKQMVEEEEIVRAAKIRSAKIMSDTEKRVRELYAVANRYVDDTLRRTEEAINSAVVEVHSSRTAFRSAVANMGRTPQQPPRDGDRPPE